MLPPLAGPAGADESGHDRSTASWAAAIEAVQDSARILGEVAAQSRRLRNDQLARQAEEGQRLAAERASRLSVHWAPFLDPPPAPAADAPMAVDPAPAPAGRAEPTDARGPDGADAVGAKVLTAREREVVGLICRGLTNKEIAHELVVTPGTAANHVARILGKVGARSRTEAALWAVRQGLGRP
jgi:DNA-binding CsgD family transcriptional regulator